ncbi:putative copper resistance-associated p-type atpase [Erysiphe necator]|uniref:Putative copper resistance-associated p-type atpase n=1 Tax=Uncinula necator TaxID=52586 RepID=A0A0B1P513_UNCNE|nr:putative copper resistance-associated p-type atpase [Erysiphe necator]
MLSEIITSSLLISNLDRPCISKIQNTLAKLLPPPISVSSSIISSMVIIRHRKSLELWKICIALEDAGFHVRDLNFEPQTSIPSRNMEKFMNKSLCAKIDNLATRQDESSSKNREYRDDYLSGRRINAHFKTRNEKSGTNRAHEFEDSFSHLSEDLWRASLAVSGMTCTACTAAIEQKLGNKPWIKKHIINPITNSVIVEFFDEAKKDQIINAIEEIGYKAVIVAVDHVTTLATENQSQQRIVQINVEGIVSDQFPGLILNSLSSFNGISEIKPTIRGNQLSLIITYTPHHSSLTIREILTSIATVHPAIRTSIHHPPTLEERSQKIQAREQFRILIRAIITLAIAIPTMIIGIIYMNFVSKYNQARIFLMEPVRAGISRVQWGLFILSTPVYFFCADVFHKRAYKEILSMWHPISSLSILQRFYSFGSMNTLMSIGTSIAYFSSIAQLISAGVHPQVINDNDLFYFDSVVFLTLFLLVGRFLEIYSKAKAGNAVSLLANLRPTKAHLMGSLSELDNNPNDIPVDHLEIGDLVKVLCGESPPFDGFIVNGETSFNESSLTGESRVIKKKVGDKVFSGTINKFSPITVRITSTLGTTMLDEIIKIVREGQTKRAPIERIADRLTKFFVPMICLIAIITWFFWLGIVMSKKLPAELLDSSIESRISWSLQFAIAVVVIACPCGLALAAPTALYVGSSIAAKNGILAKGGGEALEKAAKLEHIVFDKTGTLTIGGDPEVTNYRILSDGESERRLILSITNAIEIHSNHIIAKAILAFCARHNFERMGTSCIVEISGKGMKGKVLMRSMGYQEVIVGNEALLYDYGVEIDASSQSLIGKWKLEGQSIALTATRTFYKESMLEQEYKKNNWKLVALFGISDPIRPEAFDVIKALRERGIGVWMLSGDNQITTNVVGSHIGIRVENIIAGVLPGQKAEKIKFLQQSLKSSDISLGRQNRSFIAMVGDGINDSPALTAADVGIAIGSGSNIAISSAEIVLVTSDLHSLVTLIELSKFIFLRIKLNFGWALIYNLVALPVAAGALFPLTKKGTHLRLDPVWASLAMATSSISVICSSLLMRSRLPGLGYRSSQISSSESNESMITV